MLTFLKKIKIDFFLTFLVFLAAILCFLNYTPQTILSGWDTLHPEFDMKLYLTRIFSVWQEHQGLGAPPSQAHAAEIPRMLIIGLFTLIFPMNFVRYAYFFLMIILGPIGVYLLLRHLFSDEKDKTTSLTNKIAAFLGGLFYLFNIGTMQHFVVPLEMFATKFGLLGFLYLFVIKFLNQGKKKDLILFSVFTFFAAPMAHTGTLWYVYVLGLMLYLAVFYLLKKDKNILKRSLVLVTTTILINLYWILPNFYYAINYSSDVITSKIHRLFTQEAFFYNKKYGDLVDLFLLKNFLFDWAVFDKNLQSQYLLSSWIQHLSSLQIRFLGYMFSIISILGALLSLKKRHVHLVAFLPIVFLASFFLLSNVPIVSLIFEWLRNVAPFLKEILRFPFTKFSLYIIFTFAVYFGYFHKSFLDLVLNFFHERKKVFVSSFYFYLFVVLILIFSAPSLQGNFISQAMRVKIPTAYFDLFNWFKSQNDGRVLNLPANTIFGWNYYKWLGPNVNQIYQGAGFTWFGIKQSTLNREFDRWYPYNEQSYREFSYAIYSQNKDIFNKLLDKYNIEYIILDESIKTTDKNDEDKKLFIPQIKKLLSSIDRIAEEKRFGQYINVYKYSLQEEKDSLFVLRNPPVVNPVFRWNYIDQAYLDLGDYISNTDPQDGLRSNFFYPARNILDSAERINKKILNVGEAFYQLKLGSKGNSGTIKIPSISQTEKEVYTNVFAEEKGENTLLNIKYLLPKPKEQSDFVQNFILSGRPKIIAINDSVLQLPENTLSGLLFAGEPIIKTRELNTLALYNDLSPKNVLPKISQIYPFLCSDSKENQIFGGSVRSPNSFELFAQKGKVCVEIKLSEILEEKNLVDGAFKLNFSYELPKGTSAEFCYFDKDRQTCLTKNQLSTFIFKKGSFEQFISFEKNKRDSLFLRFSFDAVSENKLSSFFIHNINLLLYPKISQSNFEAELPTIVQSKNSLNLQGDIPYKKIDISAKNVSPEKKDCSLVKSFFIDKKIVETDDGPILEYQAEDGTICDAFSFSDLSQQVSYILGIKSAHLSGFPLKVCLEDDYSKKCVLEDEVSNNKNLEYDYFVIPPYSNIGGYHLILRNQSIGGVKTVNRLQSLSLIPIPFNFLQSVRWDKIGRGNKTGDVLVLDQAFEKNWRAYLNGKELKNHVLVNNWANGWVLDQVQSAKCKVQSDSIKCKIKIVFLPQYLEYLGFAILIVAILFSLRK